MLPDKKTIESIPSWAKLVVPRFKTTKEGRESPLSLEDEESYLRTRCYHALSRQMDLAAANALQDLSEPVQEKLHDILSQVCPASERENAPGSPSPAKRPRTSEEDRSATSTTPSDATNARIIDPPVRYNPLLLPIMILEGPSYQLDRQDWMRHLVLSTRRKRPRSALVWLRPATGLTTVSPQEELTRQCLKLEPSLPPSLLSKRKLAKASLTDILLQWAGHTDAFDDIVVYLHADESLHTPEMQDFIHWLSERRALYGLPFCLVLMGPNVGRRRLELRSQTQGPVGLLVRRCVLSSADELLERFTDNLWMKQSFPAALDPSILSAVTRSYQEQTKSAVHVMLQLKVALAHYFVPRGSFRNCIAGEKVLWEERSRVAWFLLDKHARELIGGCSDQLPESRSAMVHRLQELELRRRKAGVALQVLGILGNGNANDIPFLYCGSGSGIRNARPEQQVDAKARHRIMSFLARIRTHSSCAAGSLNNLVFSKVDHVESLLNERVSTLANELIVVLDKCTYVAEVEKCLHPIVETFGQIATLPNSSAAAATALASLTTQPRRHLVAGIINMVPVGREDPFSVANIPSLMFKLVQDRVTIPQGEWFGTFEECIALLATRQESILFFAYGLNYLKLCGLIREKRMRGDTIYEKAVLVWSSGD